ncbi:MAG: phosphodiester glycosidase family protein, partial [Acidimicrobiales bacterium]
DQTPTAIVTDKRTFPLPDGAQITVVRFHAGLVHLALHAGSQDPPLHGVALPAAHGSRVTPEEQPHLVAAFNGGFKAADAPGGFIAGGAVISLPVTGQASLVVYTDGVAGVGAWNSQYVPQLDRPVADVRQNLPPLVTGGQPNPTLGNVKAWGDPLHEVPLTARSGAGVDRQGDLLYAASMKALPADLAAALIRAGATDAMELDINPNWVQLDVASVPGGPLTAAIPGQVRPSQQYVTGWTRDFFTVTADA